MKSRFYIPFFILLFSCLSSFSQTKKELEQQRKKLNREIAQVNRLLFKEQKKEKNVLEDLKDLNQKIDIRLSLINTINSEAKLLSSEITKNKKEIAQLEKELAILKVDYASMIFKSYKSKSQQSRIMFLLSSDNFQQAYPLTSLLDVVKFYISQYDEEIYHLIQCPHALLLLSQVCRQV